MRDWEIMVKRLGMLFVTVALAVMLSGCAKAKGGDKITNSDTALQNGNESVDEAETLQKDKDVELTVWLSLIHI